MALDPTAHRLVGVQRTRGGPRACGSCRQTGAALLATRPEHSAATACAHAVAKTVLLRSLANIGLIRALHESSIGRGPMQWPPGVRRLPMKNGRGHRRHVTSTRHARAMEEACQHASRRRNPAAPTPDRRQRHPEVERHQNDIRVISSSTSVTSMAKIRPDLGFRPCPHHQLATADPVDRFAALADGLWVVWGTRVSPFGRPFRASREPSSTPVDDAVNRGVEQGG